jgi:hypothetical protein
MSTNMESEAQDPELECIREHWDAPAPRPTFRQRVMEAYDSACARAPWWRRWAAVRVPLPVTAAAVLAGFLLAWFVRTPAPARAAIYQYELVSQPRFIVVSQGEHP